MRHSQMRRRHFVRACLRRRNGKRRIIRENWCLWCRRVIKRSASRYEDMWRIPSGSLRA